jgi:hypothetical protein
MDDRSYQQAIRGLTQVWAWTVPVLFLVLVLLGLTMRLNQAMVINVDADLFYAIMTLHGLGMAGTAFVAGLAGVTYLLARYVRVNLAIMWTMYVLTVLGVVGLLVACLIGRFGPGWYLLYPLPFFANGVWSDWALGLGVVSLIVLGLAWLLGQVDVFRALIARYGFINSMAWQYLWKQRPGMVEIPPIVLISAAACLVPGIIRRSMVPFCCCFIFSSGSAPASPSIHYSSRTWSFCGGTRWSTSRCIWGWPWSMSCCRSTPASPGKPTRSWRSRGIW